MALQLLVRDGDRTSSFVLAEGEHVVGSGPDCTVRLTHPTVSRRHAVLRVSDGGVIVEDLASRNGTHVAGVKLQAPRSLQPGDAVVFGTVEAHLADVADHDLVPAIAFGLAPAAPSPESEPGATANVGSLRAFALEVLPGLLRRLDDGGDAGEIARAAGAGLLTALPCLGVEISVLAAGGQSGILFDGGRPAAEGTAEAAAESGQHAVRVRFAHAVQARTYAPLVDSVAHLMALAARGHRPAPAERSTTMAEPALPDPPTVDPTVQRIYRDAARVARGDVSVLITGESGTGKEVLARFLHAASRRRNGPLVALNCAALPRDLLESELFGVEEGVATGVRARPGKFELADGGTLFLDEVGDMGPETQARILRVLQEGTVYRLGGQEPRSARVRVVAATNRDLSAMLASGAFRSDLLHRIADWTVHLPALRERRGDIPSLAAHFLQQEAARHGVRIAGISRGAIDALVAFDWPGNVRQLEREMSRAALFLEDGQLLQSQHLQAAIREGARPQPTTLQQKLEDVERQEIAAAVERHRDNLSAAARELGIGRSTLYRRMKELGVG